jgi:hypothetical protein
MGAGYRRRCERGGPVVVTAPPSLWQVHRGKLGGLALALAGCLFAAAVQFDVVRFIAGEGYVRWRTVRWQAVQQATRLEWPLVEYTLDPRHPADPDDLRRRLLSVHRVQDLGAYVVWHQRDLTPEEQGRLDAPAPPTLTVYFPDGVEVHQGPLAVGELDPAAMAAVLERAIREAGDGPEPPGAGGWER